MNMLADFLIYNLLVAALLTVFYMFYRLLLERETFIRLNRVVLLAVALLSVALPLCHIEIHKTVPAEAFISADGQHSVLTPIGETLPVAAIDAEMPATERFFFHFGPWLGALLVIGIAVRLAYTLRGIISMKRLIDRCECHTLGDGIRVAVTEEPLAPCSWMHTIVMSRADYGDDESLQNCQAVIAHERAHIRCGHSYDVLLMELLTALQWWNPVVWFVRKDLRALHEYEADAGVLSQGFQTKQYIQLLMQKARGVQACVLANGIGSNKTKNRILMMLRQNKSPMSRRLRVLYILPIAAVSLALTAKTIYTYDVVKENRASLPVASQKPTVKQTKSTDKPKISVNGQETTWEKAQVQMDSCLDTSSKPLVILDGKMLTTEEFVKLNLKDEDILSLDVLSSKAGTQLYGEKGTDGVVIFQTKKEAQTDDPVFDIYEEMPTYKGGDAALMQLLAKNMKYPKEATEAGVQGRVIVQFVVEKDGKISGEKVLKSVSKECDAEALRVVRLTSGHWNPGKQRGKTVRCKCSLPIIYRLN